MKNAFRTIISLSLIISFLVLCIIVLTAGYAGLWLHTYNVFTQKTKVADIELSELKNDENGDYVNVHLTEYSYGSGLETLLYSSNYKVQSHEYKIYGDTIYIGGPIVKFKDELILLNFKTMYKLSKIYGRYSDNDLEISKNADAQKESSYNLNDGYGEWKTMFENFRSDSLLGKIYRLFIDTTQLSEPGQFASNKALNYSIYISNNGFIWELNQ